MHLDADGAKGQAQGRDHRGDPGLRGDLIEDIITGIDGIDGLIFLRPSRPRRAKVDPKGADRLGKADACRDRDERILRARDPEEVEALLSDTWSKFGRLDLVVNNAGGQFAAPATDISPKGWAAVLETNLYGPWFVMQAAARAWIENGSGGSIVNIGTVTGRASVGIPHTAAARAGAAGLAASLSVEWAPHDIRINTIAVGVVRSPGLVNYPDEARPSFDHNPQRRLGDVQDIAQAVAFLGSPVTASFVTGEVFHVAGGEQVWGEYWALGKPEYFQIEDKSTS